MPGPQPDAISLLLSIRRGGIHPSRATSRRRKPLAAARGLAALQPHLKSVRRAGCPHPAEAYRHLPFPLEK